MSDFTPTPEQAEAITAPPDQRMLVQAGPGTGKTEVVARRLVHLVGPCGLRPSQILVLSFSRSAVKALITRIRSLEMTDNSAIEDLRFLAVRSFDSWSFRMLRFLGHDPNALLQNEYDRNIELLVNEFDKLGKAAKEDPRLGLNRIRHFIVDEYQDLAGIRATLVQRLLEILTTGNDDCGFTVLGDPDQAIYDWSVQTQSQNTCRTSRDLISWIRSTFAKSLFVKDLRVNHRASSALGGLVSQGSHLLRKCEEKNESPVAELRSLLLKAGANTGVEDIFEIMASDPRGNGTAILCRYNSQIFQLVSKMLYLSWQSKKPISSFNLNVGTPPKPVPSWVAKLLYRYKSERIAKTNFTQVFSDLFGDGSDSPCSGDAKAAWRLLLGYARLGEDDSSIDLGELRERINWPDTLPDDEGEADDLVTLTTIHQSKGLEYRNVRIIWGESGADDDDCHEEGRVLFVGMSRAREALAAVDMDDPQPFFLKSFDDGRKRWHRWTTYGLQQLELGCSGDVNQESIIRGDLMGGPDAVKETQKLLAEHDQKLIGSTVTLERTLIPGVQRKRFHYKITVPFDGKDWCLGFLSESVTKDLLKLRTGTSWLPGKIYNLPIGAVTTSVGNRAPHYAVPSPWRESRFWLSVCIHGIGQCKTY